MVSSLSFSLLTAELKSVRTIKPQTKCIYWLTVKRNLVLSLRCELGQLLVEQINGYTDYGQSHLDQNLQQKVDFKTQLGWNQELFDPLSGLVYLRARYYHPGLKQFIDQDIISVANRYAYANGDPVNRFDHSGLLSRGEVVGFVLTTVLLGLSMLLASFIFPPGAVAQGISLGAMSKAILSVSLGGAVAGASGSILAQQIDNQHINWWPDVGVAAMINAGLSGIGYSLNLAATSKLLSAARPVPVQALNVQAATPSSKVVMSKMMLTNSLVFGSLSAGGYSLNHWVQGEPIDWGQLGLNTLIGMLAGAVLGFFNGKEINKVLAHHRHVAAPQVARRAHLRLRRVVSFQPIEGDLSSNYGQEIPGSAFVNVNFHYELSDELAADSLQTE